MNQRERNALDRHITGNYGEDQFTEGPEMTPEQEAEEARAEHEYWLNSVHYPKIESILTELGTMVTDAKYHVRVDRNKFEEVVVRIEELINQLADISLGDGAGDV